MQLDDAAIRAYLEADVVNAWSLTEFRADMQKTQNEADQLPKARIELQAGQAQSTGPGVSAKECLLPHTYAITGEFAYPSPPYTVNEACAERWNQLVALLTADQPYYHDLWTYDEAIGWEFEDVPEERIYRVSVTFTLNVISPVKMIGIGP